MTNRLAQIEAAIADGSLTWNTNTIEWLVAELQAARGSLEECVRDNRRLGTDLAAAQEVIFVARAVAGNANPVEQARDPAGWRDAEADYQWLVDALAAYDAQSETTK